MSFDYIWRPLQKKKIFICFTTEISLNWIFEILQRFFFWPIFVFQLFTYSIVLYWKDSRNIIADIHLNSNKNVSIGWIVKDEKESCEHYFEDDVFVDVYIREIVLFSIYFIDQKIRTRKPCSFIYLLRKCISRIRFTKIIT